MTALLRFCVRRPLGVLAVYAALCAAAFFAWRRMPQELMPDLRFPRLSVVTLLPNASPEEVENLVSRPIEQALGTVKNVRRVESVSKEQVSFVDVEFRWETDMDAALLWVQEKLGLAQDQLPLEARRPAVLRYNPFDRPIVLVSVTGDLPAVDLYRLVETRLKPRLEKTSGVSAVEVGGGLEREIQIELDAQRLSAERLSVTDVAEALRRRNVSRSAGSATEGLFEYPVTVSGAFTDVRGIREAVILRPEDPRENPSAARPSFLRLENLGSVKEGVRERTSFARYDGRDNISVGVYKRSEAFPVEVALGVHKALAELRRQLPDKVRLEVIADQSVQIESGIDDVFNNVLVGGLLAYLVLWAFLRSHKRAGIVGATIPLALLLTVGVLYRLGLTMNLLTLGGLALGVGMLVDSAVVLMENISRHLDMGKEMEPAVLDGIGEVGGGVVYSVLTTVAAFAPIPLASIGVSQRVFGPICLAVVVSQLASLLAGFTLVPALMALFFKAGGKAPGVVRFKSIDDAARRALAPFFARLGALSARALPFIASLESSYEGALSWSILNRRRLLWIAAGATAMNLSLLLFVVPREPMPDVDEEQFVVQLTLPVGTRLEVTDRVARRIEEAVAAVPEAAHVNALVGSPAVELPGAQGPHQARIIVDVADRFRDAQGRLRRRKRRCRQVMRDASRRIRTLDLEGGRTVLTAQGGDVFSQVFGKGDADLVIEVKGKELAALREAAKALKDDLRGVRGVSRVEDTVPVPALQISYKLDELKLAHDGLSVSDVGETVLAGVHGQVPTKFREKGRETDIRVRLREKDRADAGALSRLVISNPLDKTGHPLSEYGALELAPGPSEIRRRDQSRVVLVKAALSGRSLADVLPEVRRLLAKRGGGEVSFSLGGEVEESQASMQSLLYGFAAAVALVYIVLVAQFNTLWVPLLAMTAVPLSLNGVAPALILSGHTLNLMSGQGLMILAGIAVNNSLMLLEFIQQKREEGLSPEEAAVGASRARLRAILMTVIGNLAGLLPLALGIGKGAETQAPMAVTVGVGLVVSTLLTLLVMPALFLEARRTFEK